MVPEQDHGRGTDHRPAQRPLLHGPGAAGGGKAYAADEVPVGAVIVQGTRMIARAWNQVETLKDATAHAEMLALTQAAGRPRRLATDRIAPST